MFFRRIILPVFLIIVVFFGYSLITSSQFFEFDSFFENFANSKNQDNPVQNEDITPAISEETTQIDEAVKAEDDKISVIEPVQRKIQVEVLNGCGEGGIAATVTKYLRKNNIDVVNIGNHTSFDFKKTKLWQRVNKPEPAQNIADLLGLTNESIDSKIDPSLQLDVTIILGSDYKTLKPFNN
jgi:hypothetical protein